MKTLFAIGLFLAACSGSQATTILRGSRVAGDGTGDLDFSCVGQTDGFYADYNRDCRQFYRCYNHEKAMFHCAQDLKFDEYVRACVLAEHVKCDKPVEKREKQVDVQSPVGGGGQPTFSCDGLVDGFYADYDRDCRQYYLCKDKNLETFHCQGGTQFSENVRACILEEDVVCPSAKREMRQIKTETEAADGTRQIKFRELEDVLRKLKAAMARAN